MNEPTPPVQPDPEASNVVSDAVTGSLSPADEQTHVMHPHAESTAKPDAITVELPQVEVPVQEGRSAGASAPVKHGPAPAVASATRAAVVAGVAADRAEERRQREERTRRPMGRYVFLLILGSAWALACMAAIATVVYQSSPMNDAALRQLLAQESFSSGMLPNGLVPDQIVDAYMSEQEGFGMLTIGNVRIARDGADDWSWGSYEINVNPTANFGSTSNTNGNMFEFRMWGEGTVTHCSWNSLGFSFEGGVLTLQGQSWPVDGPPVTVFVDVSGRLVEAIQAR